MQSQTSAIIIFCLLCTLFVLVLVIFIIGFIYAYQHRQLHFFNAMNQLNQEHKHTLLTTQLEIQEKTFEHISREIHDNISLSLTLAKLQINNALVDTKASNQSNLNYATELIGSALSNLRGLSQSLNCNFIVNNGLIKSFSHEIQHIQQTGKFHVDFKIHGEPVFIDSSKELIIFRVFQECLHNIIKHSCGDAIKIELSFLKKDISLDIQDNGIGFNKDEIRFKSLGLNNIENRLNSLAGKFEIESSHGNGTMVRIYIPEIC